MIARTLCALLGHRWEAAPWSEHRLTEGRVARVHRCARCVEMNKTEISEVSG